MLAKVNSTTVHEEHVAGVGPKKILSAVGWCIFSEFGYHLFLYFTFFNLMALAT